MSRFNVKFIRSVAIVLSISSFSQSGFAKTVKYELTATRQSANLSGKANVDFALSVNGGIPAPTLEFTEGDDAEIKVINGIDTGEGFSIHWHGLLLPPEEDGVPYVNTPPILKGSARTFKFKIRQHGTYWYHSHTHVQEQRGVYGAIVIHPRDKKIVYDKDLVVVLSDWTDEDPDQIVKNLRKDGDYYLYKKDSMRSYWGAIKAKKLGVHLGNELMRMGGMDLSDVGYDAFLINGKKDSQLMAAAPGEKIRIRIINAGASSYFYVSLGNLPFLVISADGTDVVPVKSNKILIGMAETYDILFTVPEQKNYELRATVQDVTGYASGWIGRGDSVPVQAEVFPEMYAGMDHSNMAGMDHSNMTGMDHSKMDHSKMDHSKMNAADKGEAVDVLTVDKLKSPVKTALPADAKIHEVQLVLSGDMERYVWHINGKAIYEDRLIVIEEGEIVRFTYVNNTMMHHPMHLHGHFFRVLNENGEYSPMKHTVDVPPHGTRTIEFYANEPGEWMLHCHNLYHMMTGMARVVKYSGFKPGAEAASWQQKDPHAHDHVYLDGRALLATNSAELGVRLSKTWDTLEAGVETGVKDREDVEANLLYRHWRTNFFNIVLGGVYDDTYKDNKTRGVAGLGYTLPLLISSDVLIDHHGTLRLEVGKDFQWTTFVRSDIELTFRQGYAPELSADLMYASDWHWSGGLTLRDKVLGLGLNYRF